MDECDVDATAARLDGVFGSATPDNADATKHLRIAAVRDENGRRTTAIVVGAGRRAVAVADIAYAIEDMDDVAATVARKLSITKADVQAALRFNVLALSALDEAIADERRVAAPWVARTKGRP